MALVGADRVVVRESPIHGVGVFAARDFREGDLILVRDESREVIPENPLREDLGEYEWHCDWLENGRQVLLPAPERHVNHSCDPNSYKRWIDGAAHEFALRDISDGEEITTSYFVNLAGGRDWECNCGSARCLKQAPGDFFRLPPDRQVELMPLLDDWFINEHREELDALKRKLGLTENPSP